VRELFIDERRIADDEPCYVVAELGHNHGGSFDTAKGMIHAAADSGAHAVKLQKRDNQTLYSKALLDQVYDNENSYGPTYGAHREALELSLDDLQKLQGLSRWRQVTCFATAFDEPSADVLVGLGMPAFKLASGALTDLDLIKYVGQFKKPIILSTGGGAYREVDAAVDVLTGTGAPFALLHATAAYPCQFPELNLKCIPVMRERYPDIVIGWSAHVHNLSMMLQAHAYGARIIECHFTLNRSMKGTDHAFSLEPATLRKLCKDLERAHQAAGDGVKVYYESERKPISKMRRRQTPDGLRITGALDGLAGETTATDSGARVGTGSLHCGVPELSRQDSPHEKRHERRSAISRR
jgi:N-acetylneuraminate synthase/sialic acid synthase